MNKSLEDDFNLLKLVKASILSGKVNLAHVYLDKIRSSEKFILYTKKYYRALLYFLDDDHFSSLKLLEDPFYNQKKYYKHICLTKLLNLLALSYDKRFIQEGPLCIASFGDKLNRSLWLDTLIVAKSDPQKAFSDDYIRNLAEIEDSDLSFNRSWFKLAIYLNKEKAILPLIKKLPESHFYSKRLREIIGFIYYRAGNNNKALQFLRNIDSTNAENIRGDIYMKQGKYALAYGHFKLALKQRSYSRSALERAIPMAWLLEDYSEGLRFLEQYRIYEREWSKIYAVEVAFMIQLKQYDKAYNYIQRVIKEFGGEIPPKINLTYAYLSLVNGDINYFNYIIGQECNRFDGISCWILMQNLAQNDLVETFKSNQSLLPTLSEVAKEEVRNYENIDEKVFVEQKEIEELDARDAFR